MDTPGQGLGSDGLPRPNGRAGEMGRAYGLSTERKGIDFFFLFSNLFLMRKQFQKNLEIVLKARKLLRKFPKFKENSQGHIGT
jgi:hypothetical protein